MADQRIGNNAGVAATNTGNAATNKTNLTGDNASARAEHWDTDYASITALRARLAAIDAGFYTEARLNAMTYNDMVYAVRVNDAPTSIKQ